MHELLDARGLELLLARLQSADSGSKFAFHLAKLHPVDHELPRPKIELLPGKKITAILADLLCNGERIARLAPDKFAIVQWRDNAVSRVPELADALSAGLSRLADAVGDEPVCSVGTVTLAETCRTPFQLLQCAELALDAEMRRQMPDQASIGGIPLSKRAGRHSFAHAIREALDQEQFELFYQPVVSAKSTKVVQYEALIRWNIPSQQIISPEHFIPAAEKVGVIAEIGCWALNKACMDILAHDGSVGVAVNLSPAEFLTSDVSLTIERTLEDTGLHPKRLTIELTESIIMSCSGQVMRQFERIRDMGVNISLDDFGAGYSSLARLHSLPIQSIKIDRSFIGPLARCNRSRRIIGGILRLAADLNLVAVAEGVEAEDQVEILRDSGATWLQGYYFGAPAPAVFVLQRRQTTGPGSCSKDDTLNEPGRSEIFGPDQDVRMEY